MNIDPNSPEELQLIDRLILDQLERDPKSAHWPSHDLLCRLRQDMVEVLKLSHNRTRAIVITKLQETALGVACL